MGHIELRAGINDQPRATGMHSLGAASSDATDLAADLVFLQEIDRQAAIFNLAFERAWRRGILPTTPEDDVEVLADVQSALFALILIRRVLAPEKVRKHPLHPTRAATQRFADRRANRLKKHIDTDGDHPIFSVTDVRNSYEHLDERIDALTIDGALSATLWCVTDGTTFRTVPNAHHRLRVFYPAGGLLYYDDAVVDLFNLDLQMLHLRRDGLAVAESRLGEEAKGHPWHYGTSQLVHLLTAEQLSARVAAWQQARVDLGSPIE